MDAILTIIQGVSVVVLTVIGLFDVTYDHVTKKLRTFGWILLTVASIIFISTTVIKEIETNRREERLHQQTDEIREKLFSLLATRVMEGPKEVFPTPTPKPTEQIQIISPQNSSQVSARTYIEGWVSEPHAKVWLVIHPMEVSSYWVQPTITVRRGGNWKVMAYLGRSGNIDVGKQFEIMAVANPKVSLKEGDVLGGWPEAQWSSQVIEVTRK